MAEKFIVKYRKNELVVISLRISQSIINEYDKLAEKSNYSRNQLMHMALQYALDNLQFIPEENDKEQAEQ